MAVFRMVLRRLLSSIPLLFVVTVLTFVLVAMAPGDAAKAILNAERRLHTASSTRRCAICWAWTSRLPVQYWHWLDRPLHGSLGVDLFSGQPVTQELNGRLGPSLSIIVGTVLLSGVVGVALGHRQRAAPRRRWAGWSTSCRCSGWPSRTSGWPWSWWSCSRSGSACSPRPGTPAGAPSPRSLGAVASRCRS